MNKGTCHVAQIPIRSLPQSASEMVTQLLYGESYEVHRKEGEWLFIRMDYDGYEGWISEASYYPYFDAGSYVQSSILQRREHNLFPGDELISSMGSGVSEPQKEYTVKELAQSFLGSPYLWGGRHFSGIDCSGFVQVVYKCLGIALPRDASQQQKVGKPVRFSELYTGDLVFFETNDKVTHVGMVLGPNRIIHAHGKVREDELTPEGIVNLQSGKLTHHYHSAKRLR